MMVIGCEVPAICVESPVMTSLAAAPARTVTARGAPGIAVPPTVAVRTGVVGADGAV